jgi:hypothetical protein
MWLLSLALASANDQPLAHPVVVGPLFTEGVGIDVDDPDSLRIDVGVGGHAAYVFAGGRLTLHGAVSARGDIGAGPPGAAFTPSLNYRPGWAWMRFVVGAGARMDSRMTWSPALRFGAVAALGRSGWNIETTYLMGGHVVGNMGISEFYFGLGRNLGWSR